MGPWLLKGTFKSIDHMLSVPPIKSSAVPLEVKAFSSMSVPHFLCVILPSQLISTGDVECVSIPGESSNYFYCFDQERPLSVHAVPYFSTPDQGI